MDGRNGDSGSSSRGRRMNASAEPWVSSTEVPLPPEPRPTSPRATTSGTSTDTKKRAPVTVTEESPRSPKRAKKDVVDASDARSLLSRMGPGSDAKLPASDRTPRVQRATATRSHAQSSRRPDDGLAVGFSIKGAAQAERNRQKPNPAPKPNSASLLDRMKTGDAFDRRRGERRNHHPM
jgi:hypothetical protein